jgi:hypothetical protein
MKRVLARPIRVKLVPFSAWPDSQDRGSHDRVAIDDVRLVPFSAWPDSPVRDRRPQWPPGVGAAGGSPPRCEPELSPCRILPASPPPSLATGPHRGGRSNPRTGFDPGKSRYVIPGAGSLSNGVEPVHLAGTHRPMTGGVKGMFRPGRPPKGTLSSRANSPLNGVGPVTG